MGFWTSLDYLGLLNGGGGGNSIVCPTARYYRIAFARSLKIPQQSTPIQLDVAGHRRTKTTATVRTGTERIIDEPSSHNYFLTSSNT